MPARRGLFQRSPVTALVLVAGAVLAAAMGPSARGDERPRMKDNGSIIAVKDCVQTAAQAVADEDLEAFVGCFSSQQRPRIRRKAAMMFVRHTLDLELIDSHVVTETDDKAELAVKYRATLSDESWDIVSVIGLVKEDGTWKIAREKVESKSRYDRGGESCSGCQAGGCGGAVMLDTDDVPAGGGCANGRCGL